MATRKLDPRLSAALEELGVDMDALLDGGEGARVVVVRASMEEAVKSLGTGLRDQVVMTRISSETAQALDRWVDAGVAKSRSEAAALFLQEGLKIREPELEELSGPLQALEKAREALRAQAQTLIGRRR